MPGSESRKRKEQPDALITRTGGAYIPPAKLRMMQRDIQDKSSAEYQRLAWEQLKKSINGLINKVNTSNLTTIVRELIKQNLVRGRGILCRSIMQAQSASQTFTNVYAALVAIINSKFPNIGELLLKRLVIQFRRGYKRNDKPACLAAAKFIGHLVNQQIAHEVLGLEILTLLLEHPTEDSVEVAIAFLKEVGARLEEVSPRGSHAIFERLRHVLHEGQLEKRVQYMIEVMFQVRKDKFKDFPTLPDELDLVEEEDQFTHLLTLDEVTEGQDILNVFKLDEAYIENEDKYATLRKEILDESEDDGSGAEGDDDAEEEDEEEDEEAKEAIIDKTETNLLALRRTIYLTIQSSLDYEECCHKLLKMNMKEGQEIELCHMILDCCAQQRTYEKFFGLLAQRFCNLNRKYVDPFQQIFKDTYDTVHRLDTNKLRNVAKFFAHLLFTDAIAWTVLEHIHLTEEETTSSSRIFIKILMQELSEYMGLQKLNQRLQDPTLIQYFEGLFPRDHPKNTRFSINFFTSIGLGGLTDELREFLKKQPKPTAVIAPQRTESPEPEDKSGSSSSNSSSSSDSSDSSSDSSSGSSSSSSSGSSSDSSSSGSSSDSSSSSSSSEDDKRKKKKKGQALSTKKKDKESLKDEKRKNKRVPEKPTKSKRSRSRSNELQNKKKRKEDSTRDLRDFNTEDARARKRSERNKSMTPDDREQRRIKKEDSKRDSHDFNTDNSRARKRSERNKAMAPADQDQRRKNKEDSTRDSRDFNTDNARARKRSEGNKSMTPDDREQRKKKKDKKHSKRSGVVEDESIQENVRRSGSNEPDMDFGYSNEPVEGHSRYWALEDDRMERRRDEARKVEDLGRRDRDREDRGRRRDDRGRRRSEDRELHLTEDGAAVRNREGRVRKDRSISQERPENKRREERIRKDRSISQERPENKRREERIRKDRSISQERQENKRREERTRKDRSISQERQENKRREERTRKARSISQERQENKRRENRTRKDRSISQERREERIRKERSISPERYESKRIRKDRSISQEKKRREDKTRKDRSISKERHEERTRKDRSISKERREDTIRKDRSISQEKKRREDKTRKDRSISREKREERTRKDRSISQERQENKRREERTRKDRSISPERYESKRIRKDRSISLERHDNKRREERNRGRARDEGRERNRKH